MAAMLKFFVIIVLVQGATAALIVAAVSPRLQSAWFFFAATALIVAALAAIWFNTVARRMKAEAVARTREDFLAEREQLLLRAEREKQKMMDAGNRERQRLVERSFQEQQRLLEEGHRRVARETGRVRTYASIKLWVALAAVAVLGSALIFAQFVTFGALALSGAGGTLVGYTLRARQARLAREPGAAGGTRRLLPFLRRRDAANGETAGS